METMEEALARITEIANNGGEAERTEIEHIKSTFYRLLNESKAAKAEAPAEETPAEVTEAPAEVTEAPAEAPAENAEAVEAPAEAVEAPAEAAEEVNPLEVAFREQLQRVKELRAAAAEEAAKQQQENLTRKQAIIEEIKQMAENPETADKGYERMKQLREEWKEIGEVPAEQATAVWKEYQRYTEQYYDMLRINAELRAYDFKKNLELKTALCEQAEALAEKVEEDVIATFRALQDLHNQFREIGPVAKEIREEVWNRFKAASTVVNKAHQAHFESLKAEEEANLAQKTALCEQAEAVTAEAPKNANEWEEQTQKILELQKQWKTIGFTPRKVNQQIFDRFRGVCDAFFTAKADHFKSLRDGLQQNLDAKMHLIERVEELKESTAWSVTTEEIIQLQKQWKTIGPVARKKSDEIWKRFNEACNYFFDRRKEARKEQHQKVRRQVQRTVENAGTDLQRLQRSIDEKRQELNTYENNLTFLNATSKTGSAFVEEIQKRIEVLKGELQGLEVKFREMRKAEAASEANEGAE